MIAVLFGLGHGVLQAEQIQDLPVAIDQVADTRNALPVGDEQVRDGAPRVARSIADLDG